MYIRKDEEWSIYKYWCNCCNGEFDTPIKAIRESYCPLCDSRDYEENEKKEDK